MHRDLHMFHSRIGQSNLSDSSRHGFYEIPPFRRHRVVDLPGELPVVDRVGKPISVSRLGQIEKDFDIDHKALSLLPFVSQHPVMREHLYAFQPNGVVRLETGCMSLETHLRRIRYQRPAFRAERATQDLLDQGHGHDRLSDHARPDQITGKQATEVVIYDLAMQQHTSSVLA